ncbi:MAG TPA: MAPEG family protein [Rhizomicrobium sp.]|nr:MAPEG family protein [Rhizomicrobium sp.]HWC62299.1 MAPEG family protein [Rhizomicrobium sp.]
MFATPATVLSAFATLFAAMVLIYTFGQAGRLRAKHKILAPAMTGHPHFERAIRIQMNTVEQFVIFLPLLWLATIYFRIIGWIPGVLGFTWCLGRIIYSLGYMSAPEKRQAGMLITVLANFGLLILALYGLFATWIAGTVL